MAKQAGIREVAVILVGWKESDYSMKGSNSVKLSVSWDTFGVGETEEEIHHERPVTERRSSGWPESNTGNSVW